MIDELRQEFSEKANEIIDWLKSSFVAKDMVVTGKSVDSIEKVIEDNGFQIRAADHIWSLEFGRGPARGADSNGEFLANLKIWAFKRGYKLNVEYLRYRINAVGTLLYQGKDPRFPGKKQSGVITDVINPDLEKQIQKEFEDKFILLFTSGIQEVFEDEISINSF